MRPLREIAIFVLASTVAGLVSAGDALAQAELTEAELRDLITGKVAHWDSGNLTEYHADGTYAFNGARTGRKGKWHISGNRICYDSGTCDEVFKDERSFYIMSVRVGNTEGALRYRFTIVDWTSVAKITIGSCSGGAVASVTERPGSMHLRLASVGKQFAEFDVALAADGSGSAPYLGLSGPSIMEVPAGKGKRTLKSGQVQGTCQWLWPPG